MKSPPNSKSLKKCSLAVLVSGNGSNLQAIIDASSDPLYPASVELVISNVVDAYALQRAAKAQIPTAIVSHKDFKVREEFEQKLIDVIDSRKIDLVVLAGFMRILSPAFVRHYAGRLINIHPALLPSFPGTHAIEQAWNYGVKWTGVTVHFVDEGTDTGPIILQKTIPISEKESLESLEEKVHSVEHAIFPKAIELFAQGKLQIQGRKVNTLTKSAPKKKELA